MSAKEMFEKLGWEYYSPLCDSNTITYIKEVHDGYMYYRLEFFLYSREISIDTYITLDLLKAINKQIEELGWNK